MSWCCTDRPRWTGSIRGMPNSHGAGWQAGQGMKLDEFTAAIETAKTLAETTPFQTRNPTSREPSGKQSRGERCCAQQAARSRRPVSRSECYGASIAPAIWLLRLEPSRSAPLCSPRERKSLEDLFPEERVSEVDLMSAIYPLSVHRRIERQWAERVNSQRQIHGQIVIGTKPTLQRVFNNKSLVPVPVRAIVDRQQLDQSRPRD